MATQKIETGLIADSAVTTAKLADNSVTAAKIAAGSLDDQVKGISSSADAVAITIDSSENVGIGGTASDANLQVRKTGVNIGITNVLINATFADGSNATGLSIGYRTDETTAVLAPRTATGNLAFYNYDGAWSESMRITNSGKVIIGDTASHVDDLLQIETPASGGGHGIQIRRNDSNNDQGVGHIQFGNNTDTDLAKISAKTDGSTDNAALLFHTQPNGGSLTERMRIESSGQILITNQTPSIKFVDSGDNSAQFIQAYGGFLRYYADDNNILSGSEHSWWIDGGRKMTLDSSGRLGIGTNSPTDKLHVVGTSFLNGNTYVGSGGSGNIYLSAGTGIYMDGGTGSANHLDDYEEGTWNPSFQSDLTTTYTIRVGTYTKVGNLVTAWFHININVNGASSSQSLILAGLPFAAINTTENYGVVTGLHCNSWATSTKPDHALIAPGANVANLYKSEGQTGIAIPTHADIGGGNILGVLIYRAA